MVKIEMFIILLLTSLFISCKDDSNVQETNQFAGLWSLYQMEYFNPQTKKWNEYKSVQGGFPDGIKGNLLYDDANHMSVHIVPKEYENTDLTFPTNFDSISIDAFEHLAKSYTYFANYSIDKDNKIIKHERISHSNPSMWNVNVKRRYSFSGDTLTLEPMEKELSGTRLRWIKVSSTNE